MHCPGWGWSPPPELPPAPPSRASKQHTPISSKATSHLEPKATEREVLPLSLREVQTSSEKNINTSKYQQQHRQLPFPTPPSALLYNSFGAHTVATPSLVDHSLQHYCLPFAALCCRKRRRDYLEPAELPRAGTRGPKYRTGPLGPTPVYPRATLVTLAPWPLRVFFFYRVHRRASGVMRSSSSTGGRRRTSSGSSGNLGPVASRARESVESGSSAVDLAELLEKKDLSAAEVMVIRQSMVQVCDETMMLLRSRSVFSCCWSLAPVENWFRMRLACGVSGESLREQAAVVDSTLAFPKFILLYVLTLLSRARPTPLLTPTRKLPVVSGNRKGMSARCSCVGDITE